MKANKAILLMLGLCSFMQTVVYCANVAQWNVFEISFKSAKEYTNAFTDVEVNVVFSHGESRQRGSEAGDFQEERSITAGLGVGF